MDRSSDPGGFYPDPDPTSHIGVFLAYLINVDDDSGDVAEEKENHHKHQNLKESFYPQN